MATTAVDFTDLKTQVTRIENVGDALVTVLQGFAAELEIHKGEPAVVAAIAKEMSDKADAWQAVVLANTPAAPPAP